LEKCGQPVVTRFAIDVGLVIGVDIKRDECFACSYSALLEKAIEQPFPSRGVYGRRFGQYAVEIEQNRVVIPGGEREDGSCTSHTLFSNEIRNRISKSETISKFEYQIRKR
jgi:hypothetical protein